MVSECTMSYTMEMGPSLTFASIVYTYMSSLPLVIAMRSIPPSTPFTLSWGIP